MNFPLSTEWYPLWWKKYLCMGIPVFKIEKLYFLCVSMYLCAYVVKKLTLKPALVYPRHLRSLHTPTLRGPLCLLCGNLCNQKKEKVESRK